MKSESLLLVKIDNARLYLAQAKDLQQVKQVIALADAAAAYGRELAGGLPHNLRLYTPWDGGPARFLPWDMDFLFISPTSSSIYPGPDKNF